MSNYSFKDQSLSHMGNVDIQAALSIPGKILWQTSDLRKQQRWVRCSQWRNIWIVSIKSDSNWGWADKDPGLI